MPLNTSKQDEASTGVKKSLTLVRLFRYLFSYKKIIGIVLLIMLFSVGISLVNPLIIEHAINVNIANKDTEGLLLLGGLAAVINLVFVLLMKLRMYLMAKLSNDVLLKIRQELYVHIQTLGLPFFDSRPTGKILARIIGDVNSLKDVLANTVTTLIPDLLTVLSVVVIMFIKNPKLAACSLWTLPFMLVGVYFVQTRAHKRWQLFRKKSSNLNAFIHEDISGMKAVQSFCAETETENNFEEYLFEHRHSFVSAIRFADAFGSVMNICWGFGVMALYYMGAKLFGLEQIEVGTIFAFASYIGMFWNPLHNLSNYYNQLITNITGAERIFEILDTAPEIVDDKDAAPLPNVQGAITFDHVSFSYDDNTPVLRDVSFRVEPGETIALVGPTGAGKTTIINLISRFYDIQDGNITIDDRDLKSITIESLREQMRVMTQDNFLFSGTIKDNIRYGKLDATDEEIIAAAKAVNAHDFIMSTEKGYDTELKERGAGFSAGQKQLLAFARTMVSMPRILILDEATSSIDTKTELLVQAGIENLLAGRTSFVVAHRLSTIQKADRIFVVDHYGIEEAGTPAELLAKKGAYYKLYMAQFQT